MAPRIIHKHSGKIERWHQTLKSRILLANDFLPAFGPKKAVPSCLSIARHNYAHAPFTLTYASSDNDSMLCQAFVLWLDRECLSLNLGRVVHPLCGRGNKQCGQVRPTECRASRLQRGHVDVH